MPSWDCVEDVSLTEMCYNRRILNNTCIMVEDVSLTEMCYNYIREHIDDNGVEDVSLTEMLHGAREIGQRGVLGRTVVREVPDS